MKRWLYLVHRWLGIALAVVMALWFLSGVVMMYVGYPKLTTAERLAGLPPLPAQGCCVPLAQALQVAGFGTPASAPAGADRRGRGPGRGEPAQAGRERRDPARRPAALARRDRAPAGRGRARRRAT